MYKVDFGADEIDRSAIDREELKRMLVEDALGLYEEREAELGDELMRALERYLVLQIIDQRWREHLYDMDYLREGIHLRGFAQIEPLVAYKNEAFTLFDDLMNSIWADFARMIYNVEVEIQGPNGDGAPEQAPRRVGAAAAGERRDGRARLLAAARWTTSRTPTVSRASRPARSRRPSSRSGATTSTRTSAATTRAGAGRARSSRSATAHRPRRRIPIRLPRASAAPRATHDAHVPGARIAYRVRPEASTAAPRESDRSFFGEPRRRGRFWG